jgi:hypothetical protein
MAATVTLVFHSASGMARWYVAPNSAFAAGGACSKLV